jgi:tryptophan synthase alpha chain
MIEIGLPFSDPLADQIHSSSTMALHNGMTSQLLFDQLSTIREKRKNSILSWDISIPVAIRY